MLTENRREYLKTRSSSDKTKRGEYDYRILKWLEAMLDSSNKGGIGDINRVLDTLDRESVRKHLKDDNVADLLKLVERLLDILDFMPVVFTTEEVEYQGKLVPTKSGHVEKSIMVIPPNGSEVSVFTSYRKADDTDLNRNKMLNDHIDLIKRFIESATHYPESRSYEYFEKQIQDAHAQGCKVLAYDKTEEPPK